MTKVITQEQAYLAMCEFLVALYRRTENDELGALLGGMSLLPDGSTADPAVWKDWQRCVERVSKGDTDHRLHLEP